MTERVTEADLIEAFELLDGWEERYAYIIGLGDALPPFPEPQRHDLNKVTGCQSQVWMIAAPDPGDAERLVFQGDSDARIVKGLIAMITGLFSGRTPREILALDLQGLLARLGLDTYLTTGRRNGLASMIQRIKDIARARLAATATLEGTA